MHTQLSFVRALFVLSLSFGTLFACSNDASNLPSTTDNTPQAKVKPPTSKAVLDRDGVPLEAEVKVLDQPLPVWTYSATEGPKTAGFTSRFGYEKLVKFYEKKVPNYTFDRKKGGVTITSPDGELSILIIKPRGRYAYGPRVMYINRSTTAREFPEGLKDPRLSDPEFLHAVETRKKRLNGIAVSNAAGTARTNTGKDFAEIAKNSANGVYNRRIETRPDGSKVIILVPKDDAHSTADFSSAKSAARTRRTAPSSRGGVAMGAGARGGDAEANAAMVGSAPSPAYIPVMRRSSGTNVENARTRAQEKYPHVMF